jgi:putative ABC transport system permease protein
VICVFVSLLGLVGLSAFAAVQRTKEIGIRKVMGANLIHIILLLSKDVALMVIIAAAVVAPLSRWAASKWLESFAYQIEVDYWIFIPVLIISLALVFGIVLLQSLRTVRANPVDSLRQE